MIATTALVYKYKMKDNSGRLTTKNFHDPRLGSNLLVKNKLQQQILTLVITIKTWLIPVSDQANIYLFTGIEPASFLVSVGCSPIEPRQFVTTSSWNIAKKIVLTSSDRHMTLAETQYITMSLVWLKVENWVHRYIKAVIL